MKTMAKTLILICALTASQAGAEQNVRHPDEMVQLAEQAIIKLEQTKRSDWAFEASLYENEEGEVTSSLERYEPSATEGKRWSLLQINGSVPTKKQIDKFRENKKKQKAGKSDFSVSIRQLLNPASMAFLQESESHIQMNFDVQLEKLGKDAIGKLDGVAHYNKQQGFIEQIVITSNDEFSPMFGATISALTLTFTFVNIDQSVLPVAKDMTMKGTFAHFIEIDEVSTDRYTGYQYRGSH